MTRLLTRRQALLALSLSLSGAALSVYGCGSGGGRSQSTRTRAVRGRVVLPAGSPQSPNDLRIANAFGTVNADGSGTFSLRVPANTPTIAMALTPAGQLALFGFVNPANESQNVLDAASTATALLFFALGGTQAPIEVKARMLELIRSDPATGTLAQTISTQLIADPLALGTGDTAIQEALKSAVDTIRAAQSSNRQRPVKTTRQATAPPQLLVEPSGGQSGVEVLQNPDKEGEILPINHQRRECKLFAYRVGYEDENGIRQDLSKADALNLGDSLPATSAVGGVWTTLGELITGNTALVPVKGKSVALTMRQDDVKTFAEIIVVGSAFTQDEPSFFSDAKYADQVGLWREARERLNMISWLRDLVFGLLLEVLGLRSAVADLATYEAVALAWEEIDDLALRAVIGAAKRGELPRALAELVELGLSGEGLAVLRALQAKSAALAATVAGEKLAISETLWTLGFRSLSSLLLGIPGLILGAIDLGAVVADMTNANAGDRWTTTLTRPTVRISPSAQQLTRGREQTLTALMPGITGGTFVYAWTLTGSNLASLRGENKTGNSIETSGNTVIVTTTPSTQGTLTVKVQAFQIGEGGRRSLIGTATSTLTMTDASNDRVIVTEEYDTGSAPTPAGNFRIAQGFYAFPLASPPVRYYLITIKRTDSVVTNTYRVDAADIGEPIPDNQPIDANVPSIPWIHIEGVNTRVGFFRRQNNLYLRYETEGFYGDPARSLANMRAAGERNEVQFEIVR